MKLTIIETGLPPEPLRGDWPRYPDMFQTLLEGADPDFVYDTVEIATGAPFPDPTALDGILITGSAAGVYDDLPWINPLLSFIQAAAEARVPQFGICFGHQALAEALGGRVMKSDKGWGVGRHEYEVPVKPVWMADAPDRFSVAVSHQDQVIDAPPNATVIAASAFCPHAGLAYQKVPAASFQGHPEFDAGFASALHDLRRDRIGHAAVDAAIASFADPLDSRQIGSWMARFFRHHHRP